MAAALGWESLHMVDHPRKSSKLPCGAGGPGGLPLISKTVLLG
jgi:hypothetical protein